MGWQTEMDKTDRLSEEIRGQKEREEMMTDLYTVFLDVIRQWKVILFAGISIAFLSCAVAYFLYQPEFVSRTTFAVSARSSTEADVNLSQNRQLAEMLKTVLDSRVLKDKVAEILEMKSFDGEVIVTVVPETNLLSVSVLADSPDMASSLLSAMLEEYPDLSRSVLGDIAIDVFEEPNVPDSPSESFEGRKVMQKGFLAGAGATALLFALLSCYRDSVKNEREVEKKLDTRLFATLYHEKRYQNLRAFFRRKKKKLWITEPAVSFGYVETIKKIRTRILYEQRKRGGKLLVISSALPGEGKTTLAVNLALAFAGDGERVLLIEGDLRRSNQAAALGLKERKVRSWGEWAVSAAALQDAVQEVKMPGFFVLVNTQKQPRSTEIVGSGAVQKFLEHMKQQMDVIIVDAPHIRGRSDAEIWANLADMTLLMVKQNKSLAKYINDAVDVLECREHKLLGCVFGDVPGKRGILSYGYGYGYGYGRTGWKYHSYYHRAERKKEEEGSEYHEG